MPGPDLPEIDEPNATLGEFKLEPPPPAQSFDPIAHTCPPPAQSFDPIAHTCPPRRSPST
jgi:hypothetical protein